MSPLANLEIQKYYQNEAKLDGVYSRKIYLKKGWGISNKSCRV